MGHDDTGELKLELIRTWRLHHHGVPVRVAARQQRLVAAVAVRGPCLRSRLVGMLWPDYPDSRALESLRVSLHLISRQVPDLIVNDGQTLSLDHRVEVDLYRVRDHIRTLSQSSADIDAAALLSDLRDAQLLPGWYEDWIVVEQDRLHQDRLRAFTTLAKRSLDHADCETAEAAAEAALEIEPLHEEAVRLLVATELQHGNTSAAVRDYRQYRRRLADYMGLEPSESLTGLIADVIDGRLPVPDRRPRSLVVE